MKQATDFRAEAREALRGKWGTAVLTGFGAALLGTGYAHPFSNIVSGIKRQYSIEDVREFLQSGAWLHMHPAALTFFGLLLLCGLVRFIVGGTVEMGYARFNLRLMNREDAETRDLFSQFDRFGQGFKMRLLKDIYLLLWTLLLVIPGIVMSYAYAMAPYILYEHPEMTANEAIKESRRMMDGKKWDLFCLYFSFLGWDFLCYLPAGVATFLALQRNILRESMGIGELLTTLAWLAPILALLGAGSLMLTPYRSAADAAFYCELIRQQENEPESGKLTGDAVESDFSEQGGLL